MKQHDDALAFSSIVLEMRDPYTFGHSERVTKIALFLALELGLDVEERENILKASLLHDIGKIALPDYLLLKPGPLTPDEWDAMKKHPVIGERMLLAIKGALSYAKLVRHHHERWDGEGYPDGLKGEEIPLGARIIAIADGLDAMSSLRPYRDRLSIERIREELRRARALQWDPKLADIAREKLVDIFSQITWESELFPLVEDIESIRRNLSRLPLLARAMAKLPRFFPQMQSIEEAINQMIKVIREEMHEPVNIWLLKNGDKIWGEEELPAGYWQIPKFRTIPVRGPYRIVVELPEEWADEINLVYYSLVSLIAEKLESGLILKELYECRTDLQDIKDKL